MIHLNRRMVDCRWFNERCIAVSSNEAEYVSLAECIQKVRYLYHILRELQGLHEPTVIYEDNQSCILLDA